MRIRCLPYLADLMACVSCVVLFSLNNNSHVLCISYTIFQHISSLVPSCAAASVYTTPPCLRKIWLPHLTCREGSYIDPQDDAERVQWAFNEARVLLKENEDAFEALRRRLESGGATVGDCMEIIERIA